MFSDRVLRKNFTWIKKLQRKYKIDNLQICCQFQALETRLQDVLPYLLNLYYYTTASSSLVISPIDHVTYNFQKCLPLLIVSTSVGMVHPPISNTAREIK